MNHVQFIFQEAFTYAVVSKHKRKDDAENKMNLKSQRLYEESYFIYEKS